MRALFAIFGASILAVAACGARSSLRVPDPAEEEVDAGPDALDAGPDIVDAPDVFDAPPDVFDAPPDVPVVDCQDAGITYIYLISSENVLLRFYPPDGSVVAIGNIDCPQPSPGAGTPFSMAVDRAGIAYVLFNDGELYRVSTATASCKSTGFVKGQLGFNERFGMGFSANVSNPGETLFIAGSDDTETLATIDVESFDLNVVGEFSNPIGNAELTGTGNGGLFAFGVEDVPGSTLLHLAEIEKSSAQIIGDEFLDLGTGGVGISAWAFAAWGGDFYFFTSTSPGTSKVSRYHPGDPFAVDYATLPGLTIVGAGVSTCAPAE